MKPLIFLENVSVHASGNALIEAIDLAVHAGEFVALVGPNGAGKSTLLRAVLGLSDLSAGCIRVDEQDALTMGGRQRAGLLGWLPQKGEVAEAVPVIDLVVSGRFRFDEPRANAMESAYAALRSLGVAHLAGRMMNTLSGGEAQRVNLAILKAQDAKALLLDEPANHLDPAQQIRTYRVLGSEWQQGRTVVCVTHDINLLSHVAASAPKQRVRIVGLKEGRVAFDTSFDDSGLSTHLTGLFGVQVSALSHGEGRYFAVTGGGE